MAKFNANTVKTAWSIRRAAAVKFACCVSEVSWKECLTLATAGLIYVDGDYAVFVRGEMVTVKSAGQEKTFGVKRAQAIDPNSATAAHMKKRGHTDYQNYFQIGDVVIRIAAKAAYDAAFAAITKERQARRAAEEAAAQLALETRGRRVVAFPENGLKKALGFVVDGVFYHEKSVTQLVFSVIDFDALVQETVQPAYGEAFAVYAIDESQWAAVEAAEVAALEAARVAQAAVAAAAAQKIEAARAQAAATGQDVEIDRRLENSEAEDGFIAYITMLRGDGTTYVQRQILG
jgi:hypothetical protein